VSKGSISRPELVALAASIAISEWSRRPKGDGVFGVISAKDLAWVRKNSVKIRRQSDGSVRVDVVYSDSYQEELLASRG
jgi:hypothetical protein